MKALKSLSALTMFFVVFLLVSPAAHAQGKFEFGFHYSGWSLNLLKGVFEGALEGLGEQLKDDTVADIQEDNPSFIEDDFTQELNFGSSGYNWGFEFRWYPKGYGGSFSLGLSIEQTSVTIGLEDIDVNISLFDQDTGQGASASMGGSGTFTYKPLSFHLHFRWDLWPSWRVRPFITFGFGFAGIGSLKKATIEYDYNYTLTVPGEPVDSDSGGDSKTIDEVDQEQIAEGEGSIFDEMPPVFPFVQLLLGIKGEISKNVYILGEWGIFNGFIWRGGLAFRF